MGDQQQTTPKTQRAPGGQGGRLLQLPSVARDVLISGIGVSCGTTVTNPIDVVKTRLQLQPAAAAGGAGAGGTKPGLVTTGVLILRHEGLLTLWAGWRPAVARAMCYGGLRLGLYSPMKSFIIKLQQQQHHSQSSSSSSSDGGSSSSSLQRGAGSITQQPQHHTTTSSSSSSSIQQQAGSGSSSSSQAAAAGGGGGVSVKLMAGVASGALAAALLSPTELVKVRLQQPGSPHRSSSEVVSAVLKADGIRGLWKGATPGVVRAAALTASQCATYDEVKAWVMEATGWPDSAATHLATAMITGVVSTTATNPVDVIKTYMFVGGSRYRSPWTCAAAIYNSHGLSGFWRGWSANYARLGPQTVMTFLVVEQLRSMAGLGPL